MEFCCETMEEVFYTQCMVIVDDRQEKDPGSVQVAARKLTGEKIKPIKKGEVYIFDGEYNQIQGKPFKVCPWCTKAL